MAVPRHTPVSQGQGVLFIRLTPYSVVFHGMVFR